MDSLEFDDSFAMKTWKMLFGGDTLFGRLKLYLFILAFIFVGGTFFWWIR